jgi:1,4-alpha-glucan branching enzyme
MSYKIFEIDPYLKPYEKDITLRIDSYAKKRAEILKGKKSLLDFADAYEYFGFHKNSDGWVYREWAPGADNLYLVGDHNGWNKENGVMQKKADGEFEIFIKGKSTLYDGCFVKIIVEKDGEFLDRVPLFINRVVQNEYGAWCGQIDDQEEYKWKHAKPKRPKNLFIYEMPYRYGDRRTKGRQLP